MKKLFIHIGTGKTGTTALQNFLNNNNKLLQKKYGITYAQTCIQDNAHHQLCTNFNKKEIDITKIVPKRLEKLIQEAKDSESDIFIISSEYFPGVTEEEIKNIYIKTLNKYFEIHIIVYLRRQDEYLESWFAQLIKTERYSANIYNTMSSLEHAGLFDYYNMIKKWNNYIDKKNIHVKIYEKNQFYKGNIFNDFMSIFNAEDISEFSILKSDPNPSLTRDQALLIKAFYNAGLEHLMDDVIKKPFSFKLSHSNKFLSPEERTKLVLKFNKSNEKVAKEYLDRQNGQLFINELPINSNENWEEIKQPSSEYLIRALTHLLAKQKIYFNQEISFLKQEIKNIKEHL
ncbi:hypothetical protein FJR45_01385 [Sulfurimonas sediminis]|uniref:Sulfotransferase domain-containing protein n=1 Tax=Sulfurimonas sediminis TaxID=2590020 RepID=A0A7M1B1Y2_9BACT|nr:hypothetical protein [Sulfurimonas sediminis]QOP42672.1 hypothetical protein FJR45_01385 [Sulfurimonas sediminis]